MAEVNHNEGNQHKGKPRAKKLSTRMDMTPMVDLAFLLLTFFMLTTTFSKPKALTVNMPEKGGPTVVPSNTVTILAGENNKLVYYQGKFDEKKSSLFHKSGYDKSQLRADLSELNKKLIDKISEIEDDFTAGIINEKEYNERINKAKKEKSNDGVNVIIKASDKARYENLVYILDEMKICSMVNYSIVDISPEEEKLFASLY